MSVLKIGIFHVIEGCLLNDRQSLSNFIEILPDDFAITKYGESEISSELDKFSGYNSESYRHFLRIKSDYTHFRMKSFSFNWMLHEEDKEAWVFFSANARSFAQKHKKMGQAWADFSPDSHGFSYQYLGFAASVSDPKFGQEDAEDVNRFSLLLEYPVYHAETGELCSTGGQDANHFRYLDLLPGLMWRIGMGEHHFEKYNISPEEISKVCVSTEETTAANGDKLWKFQSREDPLDWRDSYDRQLKLGRPDVFFDIAPLRERFADPVDIKDSGRGDELDKLFKRALIELYPESATRGIKV